MSPAPFLPGLSSRSRPARRLSLLLVLALAIGSGGSLVTAAPVGAWDGGAPSTPSETTLADLTNGSRARERLPALHSDPALVAFARERSRDMAERDYFSHEMPATGAMVFDTMTAKGYCYVLAGENIGWLGGRDAGAEARVHEMFLQSPTHRTVLLGRTWDAIGVGTFKRTDGRKFWTVLFAERCDETKVAAATTGAETPPPTRTATESQPDILESLIGGVAGLLAGMPLMWVARPA